jgi:hypothetical protein
MAKAKASDKKRKLIKEIEKLDVFLKFLDKRKEKK